MSQGRTGMEVWEELLAEARQQTRYLKGINLVMQIWGVVLILGLLVGVCAGLGLFDLLR